MSPTLPFVAIVDDEEPIRRALLRLLKSADIPAAAFASGNDFLSAMTDSACPSCVVLDLNMPGLSGLDVEKILSRSWPLLPVIVITGQHSSEVEAQVQAGHSVAYLHKPVEGEALLAAIRSATRTVLPRSMVSP